MNWRARFLTADKKEMVRYLLLVFLIAYSITGLLGIEQALLLTIIGTYFVSIIWRVCQDVYEEYDISVVAALVSGLVVFLVFATVFGSLLLILVLISLDSWLYQLMSYLLLIPISYFFVILYRRQNIGFLLSGLALH